MSRDPSDRSVQPGAVTADGRQPAERAAKRNLWPDEQPFPIIVRPGYRTYWVSDFDAQRFMAREWVPVCWGDENYIDKNTKRPVIPLMPGPKGTQVKSKDLTLYELPEEIAIEIDLTDPSRARHAETLAGVRALLQRENAVAEGQGAPRSVDAPIRMFQQ